MQILKTFIDSTGHRHKVGAAVPKEWDKATLAHYQHHGMVGDAQGTSKAPARPRKPVGPAEKKPAAPRETQAASTNTTLLAADIEGGTTEPTDATDTTAADAGADAGGAAAAE